MLDSQPTIAEGHGSILEPRWYPIASAADGRAVLAAFEARFSVKIARAPEESRVYLDTFDWRLHARGMCLTAIRGGMDGLLRLETPEVTLESPLTGPGEPGFASDLPEGRLRDTMAPVIGVRRLLPVVGVEMSGQRATILDGELKTVARLTLERATAVPPAGGDARQLPLCLLMQPMRGYAAAARSVCEFLEVELGLHPGPSGVFANAVAAIGRAPGDYSSKLDIVLDPEMSALAAMRHVCHDLLDVIEANEDGVRRNLDTEFLHDMRVSVRRTRSALTQLKRVFGAPVVERFGGDFKWLGTVTSPVRDLDVYLTDIAGYARELPAETAQALAPLEAFLRRQHGIEQRRLAAVLRSKPYRELLRRWRAYLESSDLAGAGPDASSSILEIASKRIWRASRRVYRHGRAVGADTPAEALHALRIDAKKLRYLIEFFRSLFDARELDSLLGELKRLQDNLGDFNDLQVQQDTLRGYAHELHGEGGASVACLLAMGHLLGDLHRRQQRERRRFAKCFARFCDADNETRFRRLFHSSGPARA